MPATIVPAEPRLHQRIRFDRNELAGSFGDIGTDLPLILAMIAASGLDGAVVFVLFGFLQVATGLLYGLPMPMQPLKAVAVLVITQKIGADVLAGAALALATIMLLLSLSGALTWLARVIPRTVVRGIQFGLGLSLASLALKDYVPALGARGYALAAACFCVITLLWGNRRVPPAPIVIVLGFVYAMAFTVDWSRVQVAGGLPAFTIHLPAWDAIWTGLIVLALPQIPLSISNSVIATHQTVKDLFPRRTVSVRKIGVTYASANLIAGFLGGIPVCHGCGGLAGHYAFGARTGGSVVIYGLFYIILGLLLGTSVGEFVSAYPRPILGVILLFEAVMLMRLIEDTTADPRQFMLVLLVGTISFGVPQGFLVGLLVGCALWYYGSWRNRREAHAVADADRPHP